MRKLVQRSRHDGGLDQMPAVTGEQRLDSGGHSRISDGRRGTDRQHAKTTCRVSVYLTP